MIIRDEKLAAVAAEHGVDINAVEPPDKKQRLARLKSILARQDVPIGNTDQYYVAPNSTLNVNSKSPPALPSPEL